MRNSRDIVLTVIVLAVAFLPGSVRAEEAATASAAQPSAKIEDSGYRIGSENVLLVDLCGPKGEKISQKVQVTTEGNITVPFVGEVAVSGLTITQIQRKLKELLSQNDFPSLQVIVFVEQYSTVTIMGEVKRSGAFPIKGKLTVIELIALAEGFTEIASPNEVKVIHTDPDGSTKESVVRIYDMMSKGAGDNENLSLRPGDVVIVPRSTVTVMGEVERPGVYPTKGFLTVVDLIALAGGFGKYASPNEVKVIHADTNGKRSERVIRVNDLINKHFDDDEGLQLRSGDVVIVPGKLL